MRNEKERCTMIEYPAMIYKNNRSNIVVANCMMKNLFGFGKTEEDALKDLETSLQNVAAISDFVLKPVYGLAI
jgi:hypothetical protein